MVGAWPENAKDNLIGGLVEKDFLQAVDGICMMLFTKVLGWGKERVDGFIREVEREIADGGMHQYIIMWVFSFAFVLTSLRLPG